MVTRTLVCPDCGHRYERMALGMNEPTHDCPKCDGMGDVVPSFPGKPIFRGPGFHCVDYPKSAEQLKKDYGLDKHDSTNDYSAYNEDGYKEHMAGGQDISDV